MIAGVAGGIADYLGIEAWVVRLGFIVLVPFGGFGLLAYLIAWLLVPVAGTDQSLATSVLRRPPSGWRSYVGVALILTTGAPFWLVNLVAGIIYALTMPLVAITTVYVYFDRRVAYELGGRDLEAPALPAEIEIA